jgi:hypothetical protein
MNKRNHYHPNRYTYICHDCTFVFTIHSKFNLNKHPYCPNCADSVAVKVYEPAPLRVEQRRPWTAEEVALVDGILEGRLTKYQVAAKTGRTYGGVQRKCEKRAKEKAHEKA